VILRKAYGMAGSGHAPADRFRWRMAWPSGDWGSLPISGGLEAAYRAELEACDDPAARLAEIKARLEKVRSPFRTAEHYGVEAIIDPRDTRAELCEFVNMAQRALKPGRKGRGLRP
jgi:propionyl-CoA carboxylase beta chain